MRPPRRDANLRGKILRRNKKGVKGGRGLSTRVTRKTEQRKDFIFSNTNTIFTFQRYSLLACTNFSK